MLPREHRVQHGVQPCRIGGENRGSAKIAITAEPHLGCKKFLERFGKDAVTFVNSEQGKLLNLRGLNAKVLTPGAVRVGDKILKGP